MGKWVSAHHQYLCLPFPASEAGPLVCGLRSQVNSIPGVHASSELSICHFSTWISQKASLGHLASLKISVDLVLFSSNVECCHGEGEAWFFSRLYFILIFPYLSCHYLTSMCLRVDHSNLFFLEHSTVPFWQADPKLVLFQFLSQLSVDWLSFSHLPYIFSSDYTVLTPYFLFFLSVLFLCFLCLFLLLLLHSFHSPLLQ